MSSSPHGLWNKRHIVGFALLAMASSGFGQTFFISVFGSELREAFGLSHTAYGTYYGLATICSALLLLRAGPWADTWPLRRLTTLTVGLLALGCVLVGLAPHVAVLALGFLLIRFAGQGLIAHIGITTAARSFQANRGKAVAISATGLPLAEAVLPATAVLLIALGGWRLPWLAAAAVLILLLLPLLTGLARRTAATPLPDHPAESTPSHGETAIDHFTRGEALRDPGLYMLLPAALSSPFVVTAVLFHQAAIAEIRGWPLELVATAFTGFATGHLLMLLAAGPLIDRISARRTLPLTVMPMALGLALLALFPDPWVAFAYLALTGMSVGAVATASGSVWAERYGTRYLGSIRSVAQAVMVVSTAAAPIVFGLLLDLGMSLASLAALLSVGTVAAGVLAAFAPRPRHPDPARRAVVDGRGPPLP